MESFENLEKRLSKVEQQLKEIVDNEKIEVPQGDKNKTGRSGGYAWQVAEDQVRPRVLKEMGNEFGIRFFSFFQGKNNNLDAAIWYDIDEKLLLSIDDFDAERFLLAFASAERMQIIKLLLNRNLSANELLNELKFATTGKLYHHLNFLINIGVVKNEAGIYAIPNNLLGSIQLVLTAVYMLAKRNEKDGQNK